MEPEALAVTALCAAVALPLALALGRGRPLGHRAAALAAGGVLVLGVAWAAASWAPAHASRVPVTDRPIEVRGDGYVSSRACEACHPDQHASWYGSYHRTMTQAATTGTILGPVDGVTVATRTDVLALESRGDEVWVERADPRWDGTGREPPRVEERIVQVTGSHHAQVFWVASGESRKLDILPIAYRLLDERKWLPLDAIFVTPPNAMQEAGTGRWNRVCNRCHATHATPGIQGDGVMDTKVAELGIACEACHGPGAEHVAANRDPRRRYALHDSGEPDPTIVNPASLPQAQSAQVCGQCHGVLGFKTDEARAAWRADGFSFRPGGDLHADRELHFEGEEMFWSDGQIRVSGREYNGLVRSPCYQRGEMTCLSCHVMHHETSDERPLEEWRVDLLKPGMDGPAACLQCHADFEDPERVAAHSHHPPGALGAGCYDCHMPHATYGLLKGIRTHEVTNPTVQESVETGRPNACNQCHLDRTLHWTARWLEEWYGTPRPELTRDQQTVAAGPLWALTGDAGQRALAAWAMGHEPARRTSGTDWMAPYLVALLRDPYHAVRYIAQRSFRLHPESREIEVELLGEPEQVLAATSPAYFAWVRAARERGRERADELLILPDGTLNMPLFEDLAAKRDNRPLVLSE